MTRAGVEHRRFRLSALAAALVMALMAGDPASALGAVGESTGAGDEVSLERVSSPPLLPEGPVLRGPRSDLSLPGGQPFAVALSSESGDVEEESFPDHVCIFSNVALTNGVAQYVGMGCAREHAERPNISVSGDPVNEENHQLIGTVIWADLPSDTAYVQMVQGEVAKWQRPVDGVVQLPLSEPLQGYSLAAIGDDGQVLQLAPMTRDVPGPPPSGSDAPDDGDDATSATSVPDLPPRVSDDGLAETSETTQPH